MQSVVLQHRRFYQQHVRHFFRFVVWIWSPADDQKLGANHSNQVRTTFIHRQCNAIFSLLIGAVPNRLAECSICPRRVQPARPNSFRSGLNSGQTDQAPCWYLFRTTGSAFEVVSDVSITVVITWTQACQYQSHRTCRRPSCKSIVKVPFTQYDSGWQSYRVSGISDF
jgi:hypothetical protein